MPALTQEVGERKYVYIPGGDATSDQSHLETKLKRPKENKAEVIVKISEKNEHMEQPAKIVIKTKGEKSQQYSLLRRSVSDLKQKFIAVRKFLNYPDVRADVNRSNIFQRVTDKLEGLGDNQVHNIHDRDDINDNNESIALSNMEEKAIDLFRSRRWGSSLLGLRMLDRPLGPPST